MPNDLGASPLPIVIENQVAGFDEVELADWVANEAAHLNDLLAAHGAVLIRGAKSPSPEGFERICRALTPELISYVGGGSPRTRLAGSVYTSTEYASAVHIPLHVEGAYLPQLPRRVWFCCSVPSTDRGATPLGDMRRVRDRLPPGLVERFGAKGVVYITNLHAGRGFGKSWQQTYQTESREEVEEYLVAAGNSFEWRTDGTLRVLAKGLGLRPHSVTGEMIWINQAANWHPAHLGADTWERMLRAFGEPAAFPKMAFYGDGSDIELTDVSLINEALAAEEVVFPWQSGRQPFTGARSIMVALA
jgi:hypothetical protein